LEENHSAEGWLPACSETGAYDDLHLVGYTHGGKAKAELFCPSARANVTAATTLSLPLALVRAENLTQLEILGKLPAESDVIRALRQSFADVMGAEWDAFGRLRAQRESDLAMEVGDELKLGS